jgi:hypothetical protein
MRVIITGGTGLIGRRLTAQLVAENHEVIVLTRNPAKASKLPKGVRAERWDAATGEGWSSLINGDTAIVNLAGHPILGFPVTNDHKEKVLQSRLAAGNAVREAVTAAAEKPRVIIQSSAVGIYGDGGDKVLTEEAHAGEEWISSVVVAWEDAVDGVPARVVKIRTGVVLDMEGGALQLLALAARFFAGATGTGKQWMPWIHTEDEAAAIRFLMGSEKAEGPINLTAPNPVQNQEFVRTLAKVVGTAALVPAPELAMRIALGDIAATLLDSQRTSAQKLLDLGFSFRFTTLEPALRDLLKK